MTTLHFVKKSRKIQKDSLTGKEIPAGSSYYWWQFAFSPKAVSLTRPKPQQLTRSEYDAAVMDIHDAIEELSVDDLESQVSSITESIENLKEELEEKLSNMPDALQESSVLQERIDALDSWLSEIQGVDIEIDDTSIREEVEDEVYNELLEELEDDFADASASAADSEEPKQLKEMSDDEKEAVIREKMKDKADEIDEKVQEQVDDALQDVIEEIQEFEP